MDFRQSSFCLLLSAAFVVVASPTSAAEAPHGHEIRWNGKSYNWDGLELQRRLVLARRPSQDGVSLTNWEEIEAREAETYVWGVADSVRGTAACLFGPYGPKPIFDVVIKYMTDNPGTLTGSAGGVVRNALSSAYPCSHK